MKLNESNETKLFLYTWLANIACCFFVGITIYIFLNKFNLYAPLNVDSVLATAQIQATRAWDVFFATLFIIFTCLIFVYSTIYFQKDKKTKSIVVAVTFLIPFVNLIVITINWICKKHYLSFVEQFKANSKHIYILPLFEFCAQLVNKEKRNKKMLLTNLLFYFLLIFSLAAFIINNILFSKDESNPYNLTNYYIFAKWSYFTQLSNTLCFAYVILFVFFKNKLIVENTKVKLWISTYICVVSSIYIFILLPGMFLIGENESGSALYYFSTANQHFIVPVLFITTMMIFVKKEQQLLSNFKNTTLKGMVYPIWYSLYAYSISFVCRFSPYYFLTNMNPNMSLYYWNQHYGSYWNVLFIIPVLTYTTIVFFIFWISNIKMNKQPILKTFKATF